MEAQVQLILSLKAAALLDRMIESSVEHDRTPEESGILEAIRDEIRFQMPREGKPKKRVVKGRKKK